jgi:mannose-1-phosphate guanylyltransferase / mannose-6-phosphate isomerase
MIRRALILALEGGFMRTERPWGFFETFYEGEGFKIKRIVVNPGCKLSLQTHKHRSEHWTVVKGTAVVCIGAVKEEVKEDQSRYIAKGAIHRIENRDATPVEIVEVQCGSYLGEDDIHRIEDDYNRS